MGCGGCGGGAKRSQVIPQQVRTSRGIPMVTPAKAKSQGVRQAPPQGAAFAGVRAQVQKRCAKCSWPMNSMRRFDQGTGRQIQIWACMNRKCMHREET